MARTTKQLSGGGKDKFLRAVIASEPGLAADAAARLGETLCSSIADIRVRRDTWETLRDAAKKQISRRVIPRSRTGCRRPGS